MEFDLTEGVAILGRTPSTLVALLGGLPRAWTEADEGPGTWAPYDVVGHLIHGERTDWMPRVEAILRDGEGRPFAPFDRFAQARAGRARPLDDLLRELADLRAAGLARLAALRLGPADLDRTGTHPELGRVTLRELLATWVAHDLDHVAQVTRTMARQYAGAVGPWRAYLPGLGG
jgi:hypothetical protein